MKHAHEQYSKLGKKVKLLEEHRQWKAGTQGVVIDHANHGHWWMEVLGDEGQSYGAMSVPDSKLEEITPPNSTTMRVRGTS